MIVMDKEINKLQKISRYHPTRGWWWNSYKIIWKRWSRYKGGANGDLYLFINVKSHELFKRSDENLFFECPISIADAALGTTIEIPTIDGGEQKSKYQKEHNQVNSLD